MVTVSVCMIVRDEQDTLGRCLESIAGVGDEIIVVDTGSTDATKAVAESHGATVFDFAWVDDFAAARNHAFDKSSMDYQLWLDADDILLPADRAKLLNLKATLDPAVDAVSMLYHTAFDASGNPITTARRLRLVRRGRFRWNGVVHEDLETTGDYTVANSDIAVTHRKPTAETGPSTRNLDIYRKHFHSGRQMRPTDVFHYARELQMHHQFAEAADYHRRFLATGHPDVELILFTLHNLATCCHMTGDLDGEWNCTLQSLDYDVPRPEFACRIAERFLAKNQWPQAIYWYTQALDYQPAAPGAWSIDHHAFKTWLPHKQLALCYYQLGDYPRSLQHNRAAAQYLPDDPDIATNIAVLEGLVAQTAASN